MKLVFEEYFNNLDNWNFEERFIRNYELQYYMNSNIEFSNNLKIYCKKLKTSYMILVVMIGERIENIVMTLKNKNQLFVSLFKKYAIIYN